MWKKALVIAAIIKSRSEACLMSQTDTHAGMHTQRDYKSDRADRQLDGCYYPVEPPIDFLWALRDLADKEAAFGQ